MPPALVHYVFYPVSQLLRARPEGLNALPDRVRELVFEVLAALARDWWLAWAPAIDAPHVDIQRDAKVWEQLLFLGTMALSSVPRAAHPPSDETRLAVVHFLIQLLRPRKRAADELPTLDDLDKPYAQVYPSAAMTSAARAGRASAGALAHLIKLTLDAAREPRASRALRSAALELTGIVSFTWMAGVDAVVSPEGRLSPPAVRKRYCTLSAPWHATCASRLRPVLPGVTSALVKIACSAPAFLVSQALELLACMLVVCVGDAVTGIAWASRDQPLSLDDLARRCAEVSLAGSEKPLSIDLLSMDDASDEHLFLDARLSEPATPASEASLTQASCSTSTSTTPTEAPDAWLQQSMRAVLISLLTLEPLSMHDEVGVQRAVVSFAHTLLTCAVGTLAWAWALHAAQGPGDPAHRLVRMLLDVAGHTYAERTAHTAYSALVDASATLPMVELVGAELSRAVEALPAGVCRVDDADVARCAKRATAAARLLSGELATVQLAAPHAGLLRLLSPLGDVEQWGGALSRALSVAEPAAAAVSELRPALSSLQPSTVSVLGDWWAALGRALGTLAHGAARRGADLRYRDVFFVPLYYLHEGRAARTQSLGADVSRHRSVACLYAANELCLGASAVLATPALEAWAAQHEGRTLRKAVHKFGRHVVQEVLDAWQGEWESDSGESDDVVAMHDATSDTSVVRGWDIKDVASHEEAAPGLGPAVDVSYVAHVRLDRSGGAAPVAAQRMRAVERRGAQLGTGDALLLSLLGSAAALLGVSFRPQLLHVLYPVLGALGRHDDAVRGAAQAALARIAHACAYPDVPSCVLHHTDYILGAASHRLLAGLRAELHAGVEHSLVPQLQAHVAPQGNPMSARVAPWVLVEVIHMLGARAVPLVEDAVDEVLTALDRYQGYDDVCDGLLAVLGRLVGVLAGQEAGATVAERSGAPVTQGADDVVAGLARWLQRGDAGDEAVHDGSAGAASADCADGEAPGGDDPNPAPSRLQSMVRDVLTRSVPFLSHGSASVRMRALDMLADGVRVLAPQERTAELYPVLDRAWPLVLARLGESATSARLASEADANVWMHATALVGVLGTYAPDVYGKRVLEQAWPRWARLLSALFALGPAPGTLAVDRPRRVDVHATQGHVLLAILCALRRVVERLGPQMRSDALWDVATHHVLLDTLDARQPAALTAAGVALYRALAQSDANAVWVVLRAAASAGAAPEHLYRPLLRLSPAVGGVWGAVR